MSVSVYVSIGSNVDPVVNVQRSVMTLRNSFGDLSISPVYQSASVGFDGDDFLNLVVGFSTELDIKDVVRELRRIEDELGRDRRQPKFSKRPIDLDILTYSDFIYDEDNIQVPRHEILMNGYVLKPMQDLIPQALHPEVQKSYSQLWQSMESAAPPLTLVKIDFSYQPDNI